MNLVEITPVILTFNEAPNLRRTLAALVWAKEIIIVDSFSSDDTLAIARDFPAVRMVQRIFDTHAQQWNFALAQAASSWVLTLDADYILPANFAAELESLPLEEKVNAYFARFRYCVFGRPLRGTLYPPRAVLFRKACCQYVQDGHTQRLRIEGRTGLLDQRIDHDDRKSFSRWLWAQERYAKLEAAKLAQTPSADLTWPDKLRRKILIAPILAGVYSLFVKGVILDGWPGWYYAFQRVFAETLLSLQLLGAKLKPEGENQK